MNKLNKYDWLIIGICWLLMQTALFIFFGLNTKEESLKYMELARQWSHGEGHFQWNQLFYSGYTGLHVLLIWMGLSPESMYGIQLLFSAVSVFYFIRFLALFISSRISLLASGILYVTCFFIQQWVTALFTDSLFSSLLIIALYFLFTASESRNKNRICWILLIILPLFRPVGFLFLVLTFLYQLIIAEKRNQFKLIFPLVYICLITLIIHKSLVENPAYFYPNHNAEANVICGYPDNLLRYQKVPYLENMSMVSYFANNPGMTIRLFWFRFLKVFSMTRNYFSPLHNSFLTITSTFYFILAAIGSVSLLGNKRRLFVFLLAGILLFSLPAVLFCVEWAGRFSLPVYCFIMIICSFGADRMLHIRRSASS